MDIFVSKEVLESFMAGLGFWGPFVFLLLQVLQAIIAPIPGNLLTMVGGALFGFWPGFLLAYIGNVVGSLIGFFIVRKAGRPVMIKLVSAERFDKWMETIGTEGAKSRTKILLIIMVLFPFLPSDLMCLAVGMTAISFRAFFVILITCRPWGQLGAALLGVRSYHWPQELLIPLFAAIVVVCILGVYFAPKLEQAVIKWTYRVTNRMDG
ncbi:MAG: VTT domain-containing protein [Clostridia bacterium]|nr:VTT domain-containing protein [Clostridia bacterium]